MMLQKLITISTISAATLALSVVSFAQGPPVGEKGNLDVKITHDQIKRGQVSLAQIIAAGKKVFTTPFNLYDGLGEGPSHDGPPTSTKLGNRPTLQANPNQGHGSMLRLNGLDSQTCLECHSVLSNGQIPATFGIGGVGGLAASAFPGASSVDLPNSGKNSYAAFNGRIINPPFIFGSGGVELLAKEMTKELRDIAERERKTGKTGKENAFPLLTSHGVDFGTSFWRKPTKGELADFKKKRDDKSLTGPDVTNCTEIDEIETRPTTPFDTQLLAKRGQTRLRAQASSLMRFIAIRNPGLTTGESMLDGATPSATGKSLKLPTLVLDTGNLKGVNADLVIKPFGRKGNNVTTRDFDCAAIRFHHGMEPNEIVRKNNDNDGDGVANEITKGQMSALAIFNTTMVPPCEDKSYKGNGAALFKKAQCAECHEPELKTKSTTLTYSEPEQPTKPFANTFFKVDLSSTTVKFEKSSTTNGIKVRLFSDLKLHDMGARLQETLQDPQVSELDNRTFITARLWGVADTAPYMHDGRAATLTEAIDWHGGEAAAARTEFFGMPEAERKEILSYLRSLHTPGHKMCTLQP